MFPKVVHEDIEGDRTLLRLRMPTGRGLVRGLDYLVQQTLIVLLTTPGSARYSTMGGGLVPVLHRFQQSGDLDQATTGATEAVGRAEEWLLTSQAEEPALTAAERLASLTVSKIVGRGRRLYLDLSIVSEADQQRTLSI